MRLLIFLAIEIVMGPLQLLAIIGYTIRLNLKNRPRGISGTAYEPLWSRMIMHAAGTRPDDAAYRLAPHLPAMSPAIVRLLTGTLGLAVRWSGFRGSLLAYPAERPSSLSGMVNHRTEFFDRALSDAVDPGQDHPAKQVVILGAGWDSRAYGPLMDTGARLFEVDMPLTQQAKQEALAKAGVASEHVTFVETDFNQMSWFDTLKDKGFDPSLPTFILWEAVTMYLDDEAVGTTLDKVAGLAPGSQLAFDYLSREMVRVELPFELLGKYMQLGMKFYGESLLFGISTRAPARDRVLKLIKTHGLNLAEWEPLGEERVPKKVPVGGLVLAAVTAEAD
jgi:methyltransferase (TIGR00027 family)